MSDAMNTARQVRDAIHDAERAVQELAKSAPEIQRRLGSLETSFPKDLPTPNDIPVLQADVYQIRLARMQLAVSIFLVAAVVTVNTGMLSQILGGLIPQGLTVLGVSLYLLFALLITIVEAALGFAHGFYATSDSKTGASRVTLGAALMSLFTFGIAIVEGMFYSRIHQNRADMVTIPFVNYTVAQTDIYFMWGFLLVMGLSSFGLMTYRSGIRALRETTPTQVRKQLAKMRSDLQRWSDVVRRALELATKAHEQSSTGPGLATKAGESGENAVRHLIEELSRMQGPDWTKHVEVRLGKAEFSSLCHQAALWSFLTFLAAAIVSACSATALLQLESLRTLPTVILAGLAQAALLTIGGLVFASNEIVFDSQRAVKVLGPVWSRTLGICLLAIVEVVNLVVLLVTALKMGTGIFWVSNIVAGLALFVAAYQLSPLLSLATISLRVVASTVLDGISACARGLVRVVEAAAVVAVVVLSGLAAPLTRLFTRTRTE